MKHLLPILLQLLLGLAALDVFVWWLPVHQAYEPGIPLGTQLKSISFASIRADQSPLSSRFPTREQVEHDVALVASHTLALRTYAAAEGDYDIPGIARAHGLRVWQGIWLGADRRRNAVEMARGIDIARRYPDTVDRVIVG